MFFLRWWIVLACTYLIPPDKVEPVVSSFVHFVHRVGRWWTTPPESAWDIMYSGSFYRANSTSILLWLFSTFNHNVLVGMFLFAAVVISLTIIFVCTRAVVWGGTCLRLLAFIAIEGVRWIVHGGYFLRHLRDWYFESHPPPPIENSPVYPIVITPEEATTPVPHPPHPLPTTSAPAIQSQSSPALEWWTNQDGVLVRQSRRLTRRHRSNSVPPPS